MRWNLNSYRQAEGSTKLNYEAISPQFLSRMPHVGRMYNLSDQHLTHEILPSSSLGPFSVVEEYTLMPIYRAKLKLFWSLITR
jgi:hypothetical protein